MKRKPWFAVRVVVTDHNDNGTTHTRDYVRGEMRVGKQAFAAYALGDFLLLLDLDTHTVSFQLHEIDLVTVMENRKYHHTTHIE